MGYMVYSEKMEEKESSLSSEGRGKKHIVLFRVRGYEL